jgi:hypothetical protein
VWFRDKIYVTGGEHSVQSYTVFGDTWAAPPPFTQWELVATASPWGHRAYQAVQIMSSPAPFGTWLLVGGGRCISKYTGNDDCPQYLWYGDVWASEDGIKWRCLASSGNSSNAPVVTAPMRFRQMRLGLNSDPTFPKPHRSPDIANGSSVCMAPQLNLTTGDPSPDGVMWCPRGGHSLNSVSLLGKTALVLAGGMTNENQLADVWRSTDDGATWLLVAAPAPWAPRFYHATAVLHDTLYLSGGGSFSALFNDVWASTDAGITWVQLTSAAQWAPRFAHTMNTLGGRLVLTGGFVAVLLSGTADVWSSDDGASWELATMDNGWPLRSFHEATVVPATPFSAVPALVVVGGWALNFTEQPPPPGYSYAYFNDVWTSSWTPACNASNMNAMDHS